MTTYYNDALNRLTEKTYSDGTPITYFSYDQTTQNGITLTNPVGRLTWEGTNSGGWLTESVFSYDAVGRVINNSQCTPPSCPSASMFPIGYSYDLIGDITSYTTGAAWLAFSQLFSGAALPTQLTSSWNDSQHPATLASGAHYNGPGAVTSFTYGNGLMHTRVYNNRLQPCLIDVNSSSTLLQTCNDSSPSGNVLDLWSGYNAGSSDNGNVMNWNATGSQSSIRTYSYDALNRLGTMADSATGATCKGLSWTYDAWANRTDQTVTGGTCNTFHQSMNGNNQLSGSPYQYDAAGNMTRDASHSYTYDAENRIMAVDGGSTATYTYDTQGRRISKVVAGVETDYLYDLSGHVVANYGGGCGSTCLNTAFVYSNGQLLAEYSNGTTYFVHTDHLGSTRLLTGFPTASMVECDDYYPFGELISCGGTSTTTHKFTGKERDSESNLDNFGARYDSSAMGRFMSPDPSPLGVYIADPQSWNLYAYVQNRPLMAIDPNGKWATYIHIGMVDIGLGGYMSAGQMWILDKAQIDMDLLQDPKYNNLHAMRAPHQSPEEASRGTMDAINGSLAAAEATLNEDGSFSNLSLEYMGDAIHTLQDTTSPEHVNASGIELPWTGSFGESITHFVGEDSPSDNWMGWGLGIRLTLAAAVIVNPEYMAAKFGVTKRNVNDIVNDRITSYIDSYAHFMGYTPQEEGQARLCALGNPAACSD